MLKVYKGEPLLLLAISVLLLIGVATLASVANFTFPQHYWFIGLGVLAFIFFSQTDFSIFTSLHWHLYVFSILLLALPLVVGQATRGAVRWVPIGPLVFQPAEIVRPFLLLFFAVYLTKELLTLKKALIAALLALLPLFLILVQPSLGVTALTFIGLIGVALSLDFNKKLLIGGLAVLILSVPLFWLLMAPYQRVRIQTLFTPELDPTGVGYNSIQSMISVGSGRLFGRGLGQGVQTQLQFLPEKHTDFIFASISEELGLIGAFLVISSFSLLLFRIISFMDHTKSRQARAFVSGVFIVLFAQSMIHIGMNMGLFPITGLPLPLVSSGGSSMVATMAMLGMLLSAKAK